VQRTVEEEKRLLLLEMNYLSLLEQSGNVRNLAAPVSLTLPLRIAPINAAPNNPRAPPTARPEPPPPALPEPPRDEVPAAASLFDHANHCAGDDGVCFMSTGRPAKSIGCWCSVECDNPIHACCGFHLTPMYMRNNNVPNHRHSVCKNCYYD